VYTDKVIKKINDIQKLMKRKSKHLRPNRTLTLSSGSFSSASLAGFSMFPSAATSFSPEGFSSPKFLAVSLTSSVALSKIQKRKRNKHQ